MDDVRVRFAPSPTGHLHIGGSRTALYNFLFAKHAGGKFILRVEDTDRERSTPESTQGILDALEWLGLKWDEGPFFQSQSLARHQAAVKKLLDAGKAYHCYCSPEELEAMRAAATAKGEKPRYDGRCRDLRGAPPGKESTPPVVRFRGPDSGAVEFTDLVRGKVTFAATELDDLILLRSDGSPTYNMTVVVDDVDMKITHVIRGDDHLNNTPRQILLYQALGEPVPAFAHLSMILGPDKKKLSKRHNVPNILIYRDEGFLPQALCNYIVRLGWAHGDDEVFSMEQMIALFTLEGVGSSPAALNLEKLLWLNGQHIRTSPAREFWPPLRDILKKRELTTFPDEDFTLRLIDLVKERSKTLLEMADYCMPFIGDSFAYLPDAEKKFLTAETKPLLLEAQQLLESISQWQVEGLKETLEKLTAEKNIKFVNLAQPLRVSLTGTSVSPGIYEMMELLGKEKSLARIAAAIQRIP